MSLVALGFVMAKDGAPLSFFTVIVLVAFPVESPAVSSAFITISYSPSASGSFAFIL